MNKLKIKARSGVTLVELLVVILIVTILSVSMLPLLQPFVIEAQYAAEPIPVIGSIRTKVGLYQYDKGKLPSVGNVDVQDPNDANNTISTPQIETWIPVATVGSTTAAADPSLVDLYRMATAVFPSSEPPLSGLTAFDPGNGNAKHFATLCDIDYQELKGKRSRPHHYQYLVMQNGTDYAYFLGCFGDGVGLKKGTGYAVCEIVSTKTGHKYVGTWKRYKAISNEQICFTSSAALPTGDSDTKHTLGCYVPLASEIENANDVNGQLDVVASMETRGWEF